MKIFTTKIKDLSPQGLGVANHPDGRIFFIAGTCPEDEIQAEIINYKKNYGFAKLKKLITPSPYRITASCHYHGFQSGNCGGCPWMFIDYRSQLKWKQNLVETQLIRGKALDDTSKILSIWGSEKTLGYRNRAQFKTDGQIFGFVESGTNQIVDIQSCSVLTDKNHKTLNTLRKRLPEKQWSSQNQGRDSRSKWQTIDIDDAATESFRINHKFSFRQGNDLQNLKMRQWLRNKIIENKNSGDVIELFCGSGNFTEILFNSPFERIIAVEVVGESLDILKNKNWPRVEVIEANLFHPQGISLIQKSAAKAECLVLDPPRDGFENIDEFLKVFKNIKNIYFISCEITNFVRDARKLKSMGFSVQEIQPLDQFPQTPYVEVLAHFSR